MNGMILFANWWMMYFCWRVCVCVCVFRDVLLICNLWSFHVISGDFSTRLWSFLAFLALLPMICALKKGVGGELGAVQRSFAIAHADATPLRTLYRLPGMHLMLCCYFPLCWLPHVLEMPHCPTLLPLCRLLPTSTCTWCCCTSTLVNSSLTSNLLLLATTCSVITSTRIDATIPRATCVKSEFFEHMKLSGDIQIYCKSVTTNNNTTKFWTTTRRDIYDVIDWV